MDGTVFARLFFCFALHLVYIYFFADFCGTNYLNIYRTASLLK